MKTPTRRLFGLLGATTVVAALTPSIASAQTQAPAKKNKIVFQVSDNDPAKWGQALNNMHNVQLILGEEGCRRRTRRLRIRYRHAEGRLADGQAGLPRR